MPNRNKTTYSPEYNNKPITTSPTSNLGCNINILSCIEKQFDHMLQKHNKVLFMRFDIRFPADHPPVHDNTAISAFHADFMKAFKRQGVDPHYVSVREQASETHPHYHSILLLDGNKTQNILQNAEAIWRRKNNLPDGTGLINACTTSRDGTSQQNGIMLRCDDPEYHIKINRCFHWGSYLGKKNQKSSNPDDQRQLFASQIKSH